LFVVGHSILLEFFVCCARQKDIVLNLTSETFFSGYLAAKLIFSKAVHIKKLVPLNKALPPAGERSLFPVDECTGNKQALPVFCDLFAKRREPLSKLP